MRTYKRELYLNKIRNFYNDTGLIKIITGVRRCGKSCIMHSIYNELKDSGVPEENLTFIDLETYGYKNITTSPELENVINHECSAPGIRYLFIDEIQNVENFEILINSYRAEGNYSIFITGSNSYLLSSEISTKLTGRYIPFEIHTLTFKEFLGMKKFYKKSDLSLTEEFEEFMRYGGFPKVCEYDDVGAKDKYIKTLVEEIFIKDIKRRVKINNIDTFNTVRDYMINNFGSPTSVANITRELNKQGVAIKQLTVARYIQILVDAKILYECKNFDLKSKRMLSGNKKYYLSDVGFYFASNSDKRMSYGQILENIVYIYANAYDYDVSVGKIGKLECDFILHGNDAQYAYVQVTYMMLDSLETENREYRPLEKIPDNYPKYVMSNDIFIQRRNGIKHVNIPEFMSDGNTFE
ncbi:MAG: ATP-binding protein [Coriobacteriia bacterium]|nr:ATP-binding protein [Coriobacteriia bacterium]